MTGSFGLGGLTKGVQDEEHNVIKLSPDTSDSSDPAGSMAVGKNAKLTINTNGIDGKGSTTSVRGIASRNINGTLTLNEGATVNMTLGKGHSSAVLLSNLDLKKGSTGHRQLGIEAGRKHYRATHHADIARQIVEFLYPHPHRKLHLHNIAVAPFAVEGYIA